MTKRSWYTAFVGVLVMVIASIAKADTVEWSLPKDVFMCPTEPGAPYHPDAASNDANSIYFLDAALVLNKVERTSGDLLWTASPFNRSTSQERECFTVSIPSATTVLLGNRTFFCGVNANNGDVMWCHDFSDLFPVISIAHQGKLALVSQGHVAMIDAATGAVMWKHDSMDRVVGATVSSNSVLVPYVNGTTGGGYALFFDATTGNTTTKLEGVTGCRQQEIATKRYLPCTYQSSPSSSIVQVAAIDMVTEQIVWIQAMPSLTNRYEIQFFPQDEDVLIIVKRSMWFTSQSWAAGMSLANGGNPYWNATFNTSNDVQTTVTAFQGAFVIPASTTTSVVHQPAAFNGLNERSGRTMFKILAPTASSGDLVVVGDTNLLLPNVMGWTRWAMVNNTPSLAYQTLTQFGGVGTVLPQGDDGYIVVGGDGVTKYVF